MVLVSYLEMTMKTVLGKCLKFLAKVGLLNQWTNPPGGWSKKGEGFGQIPPWLVQKDQLLPIFFEDSSYIQFIFFATKLAFVISKRCNPSPIQ